MWKLWKTHACAELEIQHGGIITANYMMINTCYFQYYYLPYVYSMKIVE